MMEYPYVVTVPDVPGPEGVCWKQKLDVPRVMERCTFPKGHDGPHSWEKKA